MQHASGNDDRAAQHHRWQRCEFSLLLNFGKPLLQPRREVVGPLTGELRIQPGIDLAGAFLLCQLRRAVIPVVDLFGQAIFDHGLRLIQQFPLTATQFLKVPRHKVNGRVFHRSGFQITANPSRQGHLGQGFRLRR